MNKEKVMQAIVQLREHTRMSQTVFGHKVFGKTLPTQQRYETIRPPQIEGLMILYELAMKEHRIDLAEVFKFAIVESIPAEIRDLIVEVTHGRAADQKTAKESVINRPKRSGAA